MIMRCHDDDDDDDDDADKTKDDNDYVQQKRQGEAFLLITEMAHSYTLQTEWLSPWPLTDN